MSKVKWFSRNQFFVYFSIWCVFSLSKKLWLLYFLKISTFFTLLSFRNPSLQKLDYHLASLSNQIRSHLVHDCIKVFLDAPDLSIRNDLFEERLEVGVPGQNAKHVFGVSPDLQGAIWQHFGAICIHAYLKTKMEEMNSISQLFIFASKWSKKYLGDSRDSHCLKITQNVAFEFLNLGIFHHFLSY